MYHHNPLRIYGLARSIFPKVSGREFNMARYASSRSRVKPRNVKVSGFLSPRRVHLVYLVEDGHHAILRNTGERTFDLKVLGRTEKSMVKAF